MSEYTSHVDPEAGEAYLDAIGTVLDRFCADRGMDPTALRFESFQLEIPADQAVVTQFEGLCDV